MAGRAGSGARDQSGHRHPRKTDGYSPQLPRQCGEKNSSKPCPFSDPKKLSVPHTFTTQSTTFTTKTPQQNSLFSLKTLQKRESPTREKICKFEIQSWF